jgi:hypothetical protein
MAKDARLREILSCLRQPATGLELAKNVKIPHASLYRYLGQLKKMGLVAIDGEKYFTTEAGSMLINSGPSSSPVDILDTVWPWLKLLPTSLHRSATILGLFAFVARKSASLDDCHPTLVLLGPTQRLKSWLCKILCFLVGTTPERCRVPMQQVRQRGLLARLNAKGEATYELAQLKEAFLWLEEVSLAEAGVLRDVTTLMQGSKTIRIENMVLDVVAMPLLEMNPIKTAGTLPERLGLRPERLRRAIVADFSTAEVSRSVRATANTRLEALKSYAPLKLEPSSISVLRSDSLEHIHLVIEKLVRPESMDLVDPSRIITLVIGATAVLEEKEAVKAILWNWCELAASTGFLFPDWRAQLASLLSDTPLKSQIQSQSESQSQAAQCQNNIPVHGFIKEELKTMNPYKFEDVLVEHKRLLEEIGLRLPDDANFIRGFLKTIAEFKRNNVSTESFFHDPKAWADLVLFEIRLRQLEQEGYDVRAIWALMLEMERTGIQAAHLEKFVEIQDLLNNLHVTEMDSFDVMSAILKEVENDPNQFCAFHLFLDAIASAQTLHNRVAELRATEARLKDKIEAYSRQLS